MASFSVFTLVGGSLLSLLHLPQDFLRDLGIGLLFALALGLMVPPLGGLIERPFARLGARGTAGGSGNGFVLGASLALVFVPCAGPVLATISAVAADHRIGVTSVLLTLAYALGVAVPLLVLALVARRTTTGWKALRTHMPAVRRVAGVVVGLTALAIVLNLTTSLTAVPGYASALEDHIESTPSVAGQLRTLQGEHGHNAATRQTAAAGALPDLGRAPAFAGITRWLNTPGGQAAHPGRRCGARWCWSTSGPTRASTANASCPTSRRGTGSTTRYGLVVVGVHTPEFPFEYVVSNVKAAVGRLGVRYPVAIDDGYRTWDAYDNEYWPAEYLIDQNGNIRHTAFGEGGYGTTEQDIRLLLAAGGAHRLPPATDVPNRTPTQELTTETYLGSVRFDGQRYIGSPVVQGRAGPLPPGVGRPAGRGLLRRSVDPERLGGHRR